MKKFEKSSKKNEEIFKCLVLFGFIYRRKPFANR